MRTIEFNEKQMQALFNDLRDLPSNPVGDHLDDEALGAYVMGMLDGDAWAHVDRHLASCVRCAEEAESLAEACAPWQGAAGEARLVRARVRMACKQFAAWIRSFSAGGLSLAGAAAASGRDFEGESPDGTFSYSCEDNEEGDRIIRISSRSPEMGSRFRVSQGGWSREFTLKPVQNQLYGSIVISHQERATIDAEAEMILEAVE